jgi:hypothetical protein
MPPAFGVSSYGGRLCTWGVMNTIKATLGADNSSVANLNFDGGFNLSTGAPSGWTLDVGSGPGGDKEQLNTYAGDAWRITGDGVSFFRGMILNSQLISRGMIQPNTSYDISIRAKGDPNQVAGTLVVDLFSPSTNTLLGSFSVSAPNLTANWQEFKGNFSPGIAAFPSDTVLRVYSGNQSSPLALGKRVWIDELRITPTLAKVDASVLRISNPFDTETFDGTNGFQSVAKDNGEVLTAVVQLRSFLYILKERSMHVTYDDTVNPPSLWLNRQIDSTIGTGNPRSLISSDTFIIFASRGGGYMFTGARPQKASQEIQTTWDSINWTNSATVHTILDTQTKLAYFFVPLGSDTAPKNALILDYSEGVGQEDDPGPRKWGKDSYPVAINGSLKFENSSNTTALFGVAANTQSIYFCSTKVYEHTGLDDDGVPIDWFYDTAFLKASDTGQDLFGGAQFYAEGSGNLLVTLLGLDEVQQEPLGTQNISATPGKQFEVYANMETERAKIRFEQTADGANCTIKGITILAIPWAAQRIH